MREKAPATYLHEAKSLTVEAGKKLRDGALAAAHEALTIAREAVQSADRSLGAKKTAPRRRVTATVKKAKKSALARRAPKAMTGAKAKRGKGRANAVQS